MVQFNMAGLRLLLHCLGVVATLVWHCAADYQLCIIHTNDVHARMLQINKYGGVCSESDAQEGLCFGGVARRKTAIDHVRSNHDNVLLLDTGDQFHGTIWHNYYGGVEASYFMDLLGYDAMALGSHEFGYGVKGLIPFLKNVTFPVLSSNINSSQEALLDDLYSKSVVLQVGGQKIGIVGHTDPDTQYQVRASGISTLTFNDEIPSIQSEVDILLDLGVNKIIVLGHSGPGGDRKIAMEVTGVDLVVGGFSDHFLYTGTPGNDEPEEEWAYPLVVTQASGKQVPLVVNYAHARYLGYINLTFADDGELTSWNGEPILLNSTIPEDPSIAAEVQRWAEPLEAFRDEAIGTTLVTLNMSALNCRIGECNIGNLLTDALVHGMLDTGMKSPGQWTKSPIGLWNGGAIRATIHPGPVSRRRVLLTLSFRNDATRVLLPGHALLQVLEHSVAFGERPSGAFLQMSGLRVLIDADKPVGQRVASAWAKCSFCTVPRYSPVEPTANYSIMTSSFLVAGGDGYSMFMEHALEVEPLGYREADVLLEHVQNTSPITTPLEGRIVFVNNKDGQLYQFVQGVCMNLLKERCPKCQKCPSNEAMGSHGQSAILLITLIAIVHWF